MPRTRFTAGGGRRTTLAVLLVLLVLLTVGLVGASPVALDLFDGDAARWERLSFIGQTYGAASALLSAFALVGIAVTLVLQARDTKVSREQGQRMAHSELLKMALESPVYRRAWSPILPGRDPDGDLQQIYLNLIFSSWQMSFELKTMDERLLRAVTSALFKGAPGRRFWAGARETRIATSTTRRERRFHRIVDEMYQAAETDGAALPDEGPHREPAARHHREFMLGVASGVLLVLSVPTPRGVSVIAPSTACARRWPRLVVFGLVSVSAGYRSQGRCALREVGYVREKRRPL